jgi:hypothetical protein
MKFDIEDISKICVEIWSFIKIWLEW